LPKFIPIKPNPVVVQTEVEFDSIYFQDYEL